MNLNNGLPMKSFRIYWFFQKNVILKKNEQLQLLQYLNHLIQYFIKILNLWYIISYT